MIMFDSRYGEIRVVQKEIVLRNDRAKGGERRGVLTGLLETKYSTSNLVSV